MSQMLKFLKADWLNQMWGENLQILAIIACALIVVPLIYNYITYALAKINSIQMAKTFGNNSQVVIGGVGNIIHEAEMFVLAKLGGHNLHNVPFISWANIKRFQNATSVDHNWMSHNLYQSFFDYVLGVFPAYLTALLLWGIQTLLGGNEYTATRSVNIHSLLNTFFRGLNSSFSTGNALEAILYFIIVLLIASTAFSISKDSLRGALSGVMTWIIAMIAVWLVLVFTTLLKASIPFFWGIITLSVFLLGHIIVYLVIIFILVCIFTGLNKLNL